MTATLQVLDLVVNGPIKAHIRRLRAKRLCEYFRDFRDAFRISTINQNKNSPKWEPPKPSLPQCLLDLICLMDNEFATEDFKAGIRKSFLKTGTMYNSKQQFTLYERRQEGGTMPIDTKTLNQKKFTFTEQDLIDLTLDNLESPDADFEDENNDDD
jgi:hypothetical protein